jgi:FlaA1/EpsC-like NDP-sugar epimerase
VASDAAILAVAVAGAYLLRLDHLKWLWPQGAAAIAGMALVGPVVFRFAGLYREITRYIGPRNPWLLAKGSFLAALLFALALFLSFERGAGVPRTSVPIAAMLLFGGAGTLRLVVRHALHSAASNQRRIAIYGGGDVGAGLISALGHDRASTVVAIFDDNPALVGRSIRGVRVCPTDGMETVIAAQRVDALLVALAPSARAKRRSVLERAARTGVRVLAVPTLSEIDDGRVRVDQLRPIAIEDLLGRVSQPPDMRLLATNVAGKTVLVTGAGGSIGSELCRQVLALSPRALILVDNSEFNLFQIDAELSRQLQRAAPGSSRTALYRHLATVTDAVRMDQILGLHRPETIYHAAAYKHVPIVEDNEPEGAEVNVLGTYRVAEAALRHGVHDFVLVSTDKAVRPTSVMGATKRMAEVVLQSLQAEYGASRNARFTMVRFGNVLASSGSVVPIFEKQIAQGGPVTVTHPDVTRYFMTIPEAVQLILQAGALGEGGEVFVLDMGEPVRIDDLARNMIRLSGRSIRDASNPSGDIEIVYTGLRPGEKMFEELVIGAQLIPTAHPAILRAREGFDAWKRVEHLLQQLEAAVSQHDPKAVRALLAQRVVGYSHAEPGPAA